MATEPYDKLILRSIKVISSQNLKPMFEPFGVARSGTEPEKRESQICK